MATTKEQIKGNLYAVYGTLRRGFGNFQYHLDNEFSKYLGTIRTAPEFTLVSLGGFPGIIPGGDQEVTVEIFEVTDPRVEKGLDRLEGYPSFYGKTTIETPWGEANMYTLDKRYLGRPVIESGDWKTFCEERNSKQYV